LVNELAVMLQGPHHELVFVMLAKEREYDLEERKEKKKKDLHTMNCRSRLVPKQTLQPLRAGPTASLKARSQCTAGVSPESPIRKPKNVWAKLGVMLMLTPNSRSSRPVKKSCKSSSTPNLRMWSLFATAITKMLSTFDRYLWGTF